MPDGKREIHRIGGGSVANLRLKPREATLDKPGFSVLKADAPETVAQQIRIAFPRAKKLHEAASTIGSTSKELIRAAGFDIIHVPSNDLPNHYRIIHPDGIEGFDDAQLATLAQAFVDTTGL